MDVTSTQKITDISGDDIYRAGGDYQQWLEQLDSFLSANFSRRDYRKTGMTKRSVQFVFKGIIEVDLLVSPYWTDQHEFYKFLQRIHPPKERYK